MNRFGLLNLGRQSLALTMAATFLSSCATSAPDTPVSTATSLPIPTNTASPVPSTSTPSPTSTVTLTPSPTPLPGSVVIPLESMDDEIPWLPMDDHGAVHVVAFNFLKPPFNSPLVRRAFVHSVDREALVEMASRYRFDNPKPATNLTPPQILGRDVYGEVGVNFDPELARALFAQAGYTDPSVFPNVVLLVGSYGDAPGARFNMANALAQMWEDHLGVSVRVEAIRGFEQTGERIKTDPPELMWLGWAADYIDPDVFLRGIFRSDSSFNYGHYDNPEFDRLVDEAAQLKDPLARQVLYLSAERLLTEEDCALIPLFYTNP